MNLVPENINEAIKYLTPRSEEEIEKNLGLTNINLLDDDKLLDILYNAGKLEDFTSTDIKIIKELKRRNSPKIDDSLRYTDWYNKHRDKIVNLLNELRIPKNISFNHSLDKMVCQACLCKKLQFLYHNIYHKMKLFLKSVTIGCI